MKGSAAAIDAAPAATPPLGAPAAPWWRGGAAIVGARGGDALFRFALFLLTARVLSEADFSRYALLTAALGTAQTLLALGAPRTASYFDGRAPARVLAGWLVTVASAGSAGLIAILAATPPLRRLLFPSIPADLLFLALAPLPFLMFADSLSSLLLARRRERLYGALLWARTAGAALTLGTSFFVHGSGRLTWLLAGRAAVSAAIVVALVALLSVRPTFRGIRAFGPRALEFAGPAAAAGALASLHRRIDVFLLSTLGRTAEIGAYAVAYTFAEAFWIVTDSLEAALFVDLARLENDAAVARTRRAALVFAVLAAVASLGLIAGLGLIRLGYGGAYRSAQALFPWVFCAAIFWGSSRPFSSFLYSRRRGASVLAMRASGLTLNVCLCLAWIPARGALGAAHATFASYAFEAAALFAVATFGGARREGTARP